MTMYAATGVLGVGLYLVAYAALQAGLIRGRGYAYVLMNMAAAACVLISLVEHFNLSSALIQVSWIVISIFGLARSYVLQRRLRFNAEEELLAERAFPGVDRLDLRRLLDMGGWVDGNAGDVLIREGIPVEHLYWISQGSCLVRTGDREIGVSPSEGLMGEVTVLNGTPATGTVELRERSRYFRLPAGALREAVQRDPELRASIQSGFHHHMQQKLLRSNYAAADLQAFIEAQQGKAGGPVASQS